MTPQEHEDHAAELAAAAVMHAEASQSAYVGGALEDSMYFLGLATTLAQIGQVHAALARPGRPRGTLTFAPRHDNPAR